MSSSEGALGAAMPLDRHLPRGVPGREPGVGLPPLGRPGGGGAADDQRGDLPQGADDVRMCGVETL